jgi:hypothetical protein
MLSLECDKCKASVITLPIGATVQTGTIVLCNFCKEPEKIVLKKAKKENKED